MSYFNVPFRTVVFEAVQYYEYIRLHASNIQFVRRLQIKVFPLLSGAEIVTGIVLWINCYSSISSSINSLNSFTNSV